MRCGSTVLALVAGVLVTATPAWAHAGNNYPGRAEVMFGHRALSRRGRWKMAVGLVGLAVVAVGCAAPAGPARTMQPGDFKMLAGNWTGSEVIELIFPTGSNAGSSLRTAPPAIQGVIQETGAFSTVLRSLPDAQRPGIMKIGDGGVVTYETATSKGIMTFHESGDGKSWVWKWNGKTVDGYAIRSELIKAK